MPVVASPARSRWSRSRCAGGSHRRCSARDGVLVLHVLLWPDEVRRPRFRFLHDDITPRPRKLQAAEAYIHTLTGTAEPQDMVDRYQAALRELVEAKVAGRHLEQPPGPPTQADSADSLMEALRRSVEQARHNFGDAARATKPARKRAAKPTTTTRAATKSAGAPPAPAKKTTAAKKTPAKNSTAKNSPTKKSPAQKNARPRPG